MGSESGTAPGAVLWATARVALQNRSANVALASLSLELTRRSSPLPPPPQLWPLLHSPMSLVPHADLQRQLHRHCRARPASTLCRNTRVVGPVRRFTGASGALPRLPCRGLGAALCAARRRAPQADSSGFQKVSHFGSVVLQHTYLDGITQ